MKKTIHWYEKRGKGSYFDPKLNHFIDQPTHGFEDEKRLVESQHPFEPIVKDKPKRKKFSFSIHLRLFNIDIL